MVGAPKFPMPVVWQFVLHYHRLSHLPEAIHQVKTTLLRMAMGGILIRLEAALPDIAPMPYGKCLILKKCSMTMHS